MSRGVMVGDLVRVKRTDGRITPGIIVGLRYPSGWCQVLVESGTPDKTFEDCVRWVQENAHALAIGPHAVPWPMRFKHVPKDELLPYEEGQLHWMPNTNTGNTVCGIPVTRDVLISTSQTKPFLTCQLCKAVFAG